MYDAECYVSSFPVNPAEGVRAERAKMLLNYKSDDVMSLGKVRWRYRTQTSCDDTQWNVRELILVSGDRGTGGQVFGRECF